MSLFTKIFGTYSDRQIKKIEATADKIEALAPKYAAMTDQQLRQQTDVLRERLAAGETTDCRTRSRLSRRLPSARWGCDRSGYSS